MLRNALNIETAIKSKGMDEITIIHILTKYSNEKRQDIAYQRTKKKLASALQSALSSHLKMVIWELLKTLAQYYASDLKASVKGLGYNEDSLRLFAQGPTRSYRKLTEPTRKYTKLIWRRTVFLKHLVTSASSPLPLWRVEEERMALPLCTNWPRYLQSLLY